MSDDRPTLNNIYICDLDENQGDSGIEMICDLCGVQILTAPNIEIDTAIAAAVFHAVECTPGIQWVDRATGPDDINIVWPDIWTSVDGRRWRKTRDGGWQAEIKP